MPRARAKKEIPADEGPSKAWLDSYADAMTLLLAFFIMMFAFSLVDEDKFIDFKFGVAQAMGKANPTVDGGIGILERGNGVAEMVSAPPVATTASNGGEGEDGDATGTGQDGDADDVSEFSEELSGEVTPANIEQLMQELQEGIARVGATELVSLDQDPRGLVIRFDSEVLFQSGAALIRDEGAAVLDAVSLVLNSIDNQLVVEGHTDDIPTSGTDWPTNWELSGARASNVVRYLEELRGIPAVRLSMAGYSSTRPLTSNATAAGRARNRRVEVIVIVEPLFEQIAAPIDVPDIVAAVRPVDVYGGGVDPGIVDSPAVPEPVVTESTDPATANPAPEEPADEPRTTTVPPRSVNILELNADI